MINRILSEEEALDEGREAEEEIQGEILKYLELTDGWISNGAFR